MITARRSLATVFIILFAFNVIFAQQESTPGLQSSIPIVTATASTERVRYVSIGEAYQTRLQVFSPNGAQAYDSGLRLGNLVDWQLQDQQGQRLSSGSYLFVVSVSDFSGQLIQKYGTAVLEEGQVYLEQSSLTDLSLSQKVMLKASKQLESITPIDRIGAAGLNRATSTDTASNPNNGKMQTSSTTAAMTTTQTPPSAVSGTGTPGKIVKWINNTGSLGDSNIFESASGNIGFGTTTPNAQSLFHLHKQQNSITTLFASNNSTGNQALVSMRAGLNPTDNGVNYITMTMLGMNWTTGVGAPFFKARTGAIEASGSNFGIGNLSNTEPIIFYTTSARAERMRIDVGGNIGIGTTTPQSKLDVVGTINATQYNLDGQRVFSIPGGSNTFVGNSAGNPGTPGSENTFVGQAAGANNTASNNTFIGGSAGFNNTSGNTNTFVGHLAGGGNTSGGNNAFLGDQAGSNNTSGGFNTFVGNQAGLNNTTGGFNTLIGFQAGFNSTTVSDNTFIGNSAGFSNMTGGANTFVGNNVGYANTSGGANTFVGNVAGRNNTSGYDNSFFGQVAGFNNTAGNQNSFFGSTAGVSNTTGSDNTAFGFQAGQINNFGFGNTSVGSKAGQNNTASYNAFFGNNAGQNNSSGMSNTFIGQAAGLSNTMESNNVFIGVSSNGAADVTNSTAIGFRASVTQSNSLVLGSINGVNEATASTNVGIGTTAPKDKLEIQGGNLLLGSPGQGIILKSPDGSTCRLLTIDNAGNLVNSLVACP